MKTIIAAIALMVLATGCTSHGVKVDSSTVAGTSQSKAEIFDKFGQPNIAKDIPAGMSWDYIQVDVRPSGWTYVPIVGMAAGGNHYTVTVTSFIFNVEGNMIHTYATKDEEASNMWADMVRIGDAATGDTNGFQGAVDRTEREVLSINRPWVWNTDIANTTGFYLMYQEAR